MIKFKNGGDDAPIIENTSGGKQSVPIGDFTLLPTYFAKHYVKNLARDLGKEDIGEAYIELLNFLEYLDIDCLLDAVNSLTEEPLTAIASVMEAGLKKYPRNNWKKVPCKDHINHALCHLYMAIHGDDQDEHVEHAICRIALAYDTFLLSEEEVI